MSARKPAVLTCPLIGKPTSGCLEAGCVHFVPLARRPCPTAAMLLLALPLMALAGCFHHAPPPPPPVASGPPALPPSITTIPSVPPSMPDPGKPNVELTDTKPAPTVEPPTRPHRTLRKKRTTEGTAPATSTAATTVPAPAAPAATPPPEGAAAALPSAAKQPELGQLSAGNSADSKELSSMIEQIHALELRLANLKHSPSGDEEATAVQIRLFLAKARQATNSNDLDGARTLALKAKVLLDELTDL